MGEMVPELVSVRLAVTEPDPAAVRYTAAGAVYLSPTLMFSAPSFEAWQGIQDLHFQSIGQPGLASTGTIGGMSEAEAFGAYSTAVASVLGQLAVTDPLVGNRLLGGLNDFLDFGGRMDGLEGPFLSAFGSAAQLGETQHTHRAGQLWGSIPQPQTFGGNALRTTVLDAATGQIKMPTAGEFGQTFGAGQDLRAGLHELHHQSGSHPPAGGDGQAAAALLRAGVAMGVVQSFHAAGAAVGTELGAQLGTLLGLSLGPIGGIIGGLIGGIVAFFVTGLASSSPGHAAPAHAHHPAAKGEHVVVHSSPVVHRDGHGYHYNKSTGKVEERHGATGHGGSSSHPPSSSEPRPTIHPAPHKCFREDDGTFDTEFALPSWASSVAVAPSVVPEGAGVDGLISYLGDGALSFEALPALDATGAIETAGMLENVLAPETLVQVDPGHVAVGPGELVAVGPGEPVVQVVDPGRFVNQQLRSVLLARLRAANVPAGTPLYEAMEILRRQ